MCDETLNGRDYLSERKEIVMKWLLNIMLALGTATSAFAGSGASEDNSGFLVWGFLGMCGLIVVLQLFPTLMVMLGFAKGISGEKKKAENPAS